MIEIRQATEADRDLLQNLYIQEIENHPERASAFADALIVKFKTLLAFQNRTVCGSLSWDSRGGYEDGVIELASIGVNEPFRRQGIASRLVEQMIMDAKAFYGSRGYCLRSIILFMEGKNDGARKFYSTIGFTEVARIPNLYPHDDAAIWVQHLPL
jgi:ribosomal protein S18 acetylase RimI-like enzyme